MKKIIAFSLLLSLGAVWPAVPQAEEASLVFSQKSLTPEAALKVAKAALEACRKAGFQAAVAVVDRGGNMQVMLRDRFAGAHTPEVARRKAWTALSFRTNTIQMSENSQAGKSASGVRQVPGALMLGGGVMIRAGGELIGAIGVSGAPGGQADEDCAVIGIASIQDDLDF
ncbi:MAG: heme-binding protein [Rhodospirillaceae bacterium]|nr:heme-binding protein [Rhodospirillaceae bacterium]MBT4940172.1 heme-binding protein [Rhodospirillaceae bacterium]MBT5939400.1 heme-binding protein [Rhodospirillaceae bacterium]MBT7268825.1 heme-binding protein [Rhodospirillaceae bacterium]